MKRIGCVIEKDLYKQIKLKCFELEITITDYLISLIKNDLEIKKDIRK